MGLVENCNRAAIGLDPMTYATHAPLNIERKERSVPRIVVST